MLNSLLPKPQFIFAARLLQHRRQLVAQVAANAVTAKHGRRNQKGLYTDERSHYVPEPTTTVLWTTNRHYSITKAAKVASDEDSGSTVGGEQTSLEEVDSEISNFSLKKLLYSEPDELLDELNRCQDCKQLLQTIGRFEGNLLRHHRVQCIILLWTLCRNSDETATSKLLTPAVLESILTGLRPHVHTLNPNELGCCYLYLRKMGVPSTHPVVEELLQQALHTVERTTASQVPLPALSRLVVGINTDRDFHNSTLCRHFMPHIEAHVNVCRTAEDARLLAICLLNLQQLVESDTLSAFKRRVHELLATGAINASTSKAILKILHMLNLPVWSHRNAQLTRDLLLALQPSIDQLNDKELKTVVRIFQYHFEPAAMVEPLTHATEQQLRKRPTSDALVSFMPFVEPRRREPLIALFKKLLTSKECWLQPHASGNFFTILRGLKISDVKVCDTYWNGVVCELDSHTDEKMRQLHFMRHCHRYMNFNNNLGGTYRHLAIERKLSQMAMDAIESNTTAGHSPAKIARFASFVLAYGHTHLCWKKFPNDILSKIISMANEFSIMDCFLISRGVQIATEMRFRYHTPSVLGMQLSTIDSVLSDCAERHLSREEPLTASDLNLIVRSLGNRKTLKNAIVYHEALHKYNEFDCSELNSRTIRDMTYNFNSSNYFVAKVLDEMFDYIEKNHEHVTGETVEKVLSCAYNLGYTPQSLEVLEYAALILMRDFNTMSGLSLVQACLALCFYKTIPEDLINKVFCMKFIQRIEDEIQMCYSKATYPERVLNFVMQLNRTVCLDFPEANVPWFQQNYLEAQLSKKPHTSSRFNDNVKQLLDTLLIDDTYYRCNHTTPYGYQIDFVIHFDNNKKPIPTPAETTMLDRITKVAILLLKLDSFCENDLTALRGPESLKIKHLEMMGYKVLHINEHDWNSKYMVAPGAKEKYLKCLLQISN